MARLFKMRRLGLASLLVLTVVTLTFGFQKTSQSMMWDVRPPNFYLDLLGSDPTFTPFIVGYSAETNNTFFPAADVIRLLNHIWPDSTVTIDFHNFLTRNGINIDLSNARATVPAFIVFAFIKSKIP